MLSNLLTDGLVPPLVGEIKITAIAIRNPFLIVFWYFSNI